MSTTRQKWIITGGAGFIGCHAAERLLRKGHSVVVTDNLSRHGSRQNLAWLREHGLDDFVEADVRDRGAMGALLRRHAAADAVLHLASQTAVTTSIADPVADFETNAIGTFNVLEAVRGEARGRPAVLYSSTNKVYGALDHLAITETDRRYVLRDRPNGIDEREPLNFCSPYGCSKGAGDQYVSDYARIYGLRTVVLRQSCIYGSRQFGVEDQGWIAWFLTAAFAGKPLAIYGNGKQVRDALWVDDLVDVYLAAYEHLDVASGETFNIGGGPENVLSLLDLLDWLRERVARDPSPGFREGRPGDQLVFVSCNAKAQRLLGWRPQVRIGEGLTKIFDWIRDNQGVLLAP